VEFEQQPGKIANGDSSAVACDHYRRYREDFALLREMNQNAHRLSIEWSRIEPSQGEFDARQIRHYRDVLGELREQGMQPMVTLHHFTSPLWFVRKGGWAASGSAHRTLSERPGRRHVFERAHLERSVALFTPLGSLQLPQVDHTRGGVSDGRHGL